MPHRLQPPVDSKLVFESLDFNLLHVLEEVQAVDSR